MIALDTNVLVRLLTRDEPGQARLAADLLKSNEVFVGKTVLLELEWVLRFAYGFDRHSIRGAMLALLGLPTLRIEDEAAVAGALDAFEGGLDFADALHLYSSDDSVVEFATFDRDMARQALSIEGGTRVHLLKAPVPSR